MPVSGVQDSRRVCGPFSVWLNWMLLARRTCVSEYASPGTEGGLFVVNGDLALDSCMCDDDDDCLA